MKRSEDVGSAIQRLLGDASFVFPSEIAAEYWRRHATRFSAGRAVRSDRFISWDTFKERHLSGNREEAPTNRIVRRLFAELVCSKNEHGGVFGELIPPAHQSKSRRFAPSTAALLPLLPLLLADSASGRVALSAQLLADFTKLLKIYNEFLADRDLFEPAFETLGRGTIDTSHFLFVYPELIDDFPTAASDLHTITPLPVDAHRVQRFETSIEELDSLAERVGALLTAGTHPADIVVSAAGLDEIDSMIEEAARIRSLPLEIRSGSALGSRAFGSLFSRIRQCVASKFDLRLLHELLIDPHIPWRNEAINHQLVRFGIDNRCGRNGRIDIWSDRLRFANVRLAGYYRSLRTAFVGLVESADVERLRKAVVAFSNEFIDLSRLPASGVHIAESVLDSLARLARIEALVGSDSIVGNPLSIWIEALSEQVYVVQSANQNEAVRVYPYRVAAGIQPSFHLVVNVSDPKARVVHRRYPHLPLHIQGRDEADSRDVSELFLRAYAVSGDVVEFSSSDLSPRGALIAPPYLEAGGRTVGENPRSANAKDHFAVEHDYWNGGEFPKSLYPLQYESLMRTPTLEGRIDLTSSVFDDSELRSILADRGKANGLLRITATGLDSWSKCPFEFLVSRLLGIEQVAYSVESVDPMNEGRLLHQIAAALFGSAGAAASEATARAADPTAVVDLAAATRVAGEAEGASAPGAAVATGIAARKAAIDRHLTDIAKSERRFAQPNSLITGERIAELRRMLVRFVEWDAEQPRSRTIAVEQTYETQIGAVVLHGRIDRMMARREGLAIIDYKRGNTPARSALHPFDSADSYQIPLYILLAESTGESVGAVSYYSFRHRKEAPVFHAASNTSWFTRPEIDQFVTAAKSKVEEMAAGVETGDYRAPRESGGCVRCPVRSICRRRFVVR